MIVARIGTLQGACIRALPAALLLGLGLSAPAAHAATNIVVTTNGDAGSGTTCTLRQAIVSMNVGSVGGTDCLPSTISGSGNTITFDTTLFPDGGANTITLADAADNSLKITAPDLTIDASANGNVTVQRSRSSSDNTNAFRVLYDYAASSSLSLKHLTISNGNQRSTTTGTVGGGIACNCASLTLDHSVVSGNAVYGTYTNSSNAQIPAGFGGGVFVYGASLTVNNSTISGNSAYGYGGGIAALPAGAIPANTTISGSTIDNNSDTGRHGGGAFLVGTLTAADTIVSGNSTTGNGGGLHLVRAATLTRTTISGNTAGNNGGGMKVYGVTTLANSTVSGNIASNNGGGIFDSSGYYGVPSALLTLNASTLDGNQVTNPSGSRGGAIFTRVGNLSFTNSTISGNSAASGYGYGGGIYVRQNIDPITLQQTTIASNTAGARGGGLMIKTSGAGVVNFTGSLFANTDAPSTGGGNIAVTTGGITIDGGANLVFGGGLINATFNAMPSTGDPVLAPLGNFGGPTRTRLPLAGSAAIDSIPAVSGQCPVAVDQRDVARPQGNGCDIGAVEHDNDVIFLNGFDPP